MTDKEKIKAEIKRQIAELTKEKIGIVGGMAIKRHLESILSFIDSLQEEPVSELLNTESMIESYKQRLISQTNGVKNSPLIDMCLGSYKNGINETLDTLNLSNVQKTVKELKEPASEGLEEAAKYCIPDESYHMTIESKEEGSGENVYDYVQMLDMFKAGAQWQKTKMIANAIDAEVLENYDGKVLEYDDSILDDKLSDCKIFDKVKVIVFKGE